MILLGTLIKQSVQARGPFVDQVGDRDPELAGLISAEASRQGVSVDDFVADTISRFMSAEDGESWTTIVGNIQRSDDPGFAFVETIMRKRLSHRCNH